MLCPRGQSGLEDKILASASTLKLWPGPRPRSFGLGLKVLASFNITANTTTTQ